jgi:hypothetical protein
VPGKFIDVLTPIKVDFSGEYKPSSPFTFKNALYNLDATFRKYDGIFGTLWLCIGCQRVVRLMEDTKHDSENWWRTLITGVEGFFTLAGDDCRDHGMLYWEWIKRIHAAILEENLGMVQGLLVFSTGEQGTDLVTYTRAVAEAGYMRRFVITEKGRLGWAPKWSEEGDRVVVVHGSTMPWIVRKKKEGWVRIGACYIEGIMFREAMIGGEASIEDIILC